MRKIISMHDHRLKSISIDTHKISCSCGKDFIHINQFNSHLKQEVSYQLKKYEVEVV